MKPRLGLSGLPLVRRQRSFAGRATVDPAVCQGIGGTPQGPDSNCDAKPCHSCIFPSDCDDGNPCTADSCDPIRGSFQHVSLDSDDLTTFEHCTTGLDVVGPPASCRQSDSDRGDPEGHKDVDQEHFGIFQRCYSGADRQVNPHCVN